MAGSVGGGIGVSRPPTSGPSSNPLKLAVDKTQRAQPTSAPKPGLIAPNKPISTSTPTPQGMKSESPVLSSTQSQNAEPKSNKSTPASNSSKSSSLSMAQHIGASAPPKYPSNVSKAIAPPLKPQQAQPKEQQAQPKEQQAQPKEQPKPQSKDPPKEQPGQPKEQPQLPKMQPTPQPQEIKSVQQALQAPPKPSIPPPPPPPQQQQVQGDDRELELLRAGPESLPK